jgi:hypothetical protein
LYTNNYAIWIEARFMLTVCCVWVVRLWQCAWLWMCVAILNVLMQKLYVRALAGVLIKRSYDFPWFKYSVKFRNDAYLYWKKKKQNSHSVAMRQTVMMKTGCVCRMWYCPQNVGILPQWYIFICVIAMNVKVCVMCNFNAIKRGYKDYAQLWREEINSNWRISDKIIIIIIIPKLWQYFTKLRSYTIVEVSPLH